MLAIKAFGRGAYQRTRVNSSGAPTGFLTRKKKAFGFQTGDIVLAVVPSGKRRGTHLGRVAVRARGSFNVQNEVCDSSRTSVTDIAGSSSGPTGTVINSDKRQFTPHPKG